MHNYGSVIHATGMGHAWVNSLIITIPATLLPLTLGALAAFGFAWVPFPFRDTLFLAIIALMVVPIQTSLVPLLKLFREWHLNTPTSGSVPLRSSVSGSRTPPSDCHSRSSS